MRIWITMPCVTARAESSWSRWVRLLREFDLAQKQVTMTRSRGRRGRPRMKSVMLWMIWEPVPRVRLLNDECVSNCW